MSPHLEHLLFAPAVASLALLAWQWTLVRRFPLRQPAPPPATWPSLAILKPVKGLETATRECLQSWLEQDYPGRVVFHFAVETGDPATAQLVSDLLARHPNREARCWTCKIPLDGNAKVAKLAVMEREAKAEWIIASDADVFAPPGYLANLASELAGGSADLHCALYIIRGGSSLPDQLEAISANADFWGQVLQNRSLRGLKFALGAVMAVRPEKLVEAGGFASLSPYLADDYHLGRAISRVGGRVELTHTPVECRADSMNLRKLWQHQLRWAVTIRSCEPLPWFLSIVSNTTLWCLVCLAANPHQPTAWLLASAGMAARSLAAWDSCRKFSPTALPKGIWWMVWLKDVTQAALWLASWWTREVVWRGRRHRVARDGTLTAVP